MNLHKTHAPDSPRREPLHESGPRWFISQEGSRQSYAVPLAFHRLGVLGRFYVDSWCRWGRSLFKQGPKGLRALATHFNSELPAERVVSFNSSVLFSRAQFHFQRNRLSPDELADEYCRFGKKFATLVREHLKREHLDPERDAFFGFNTNCLETIEHLRGRGVLTVVDQVDPARVEEDLCAEEAEQWPGWSKNPGRMPQGYWDRIAAEWDAADLVLVNSQWSADALTKQGVPEDKIIIAPQAIDFGRSHAHAPVVALGPLKVLWLGSIILRKGIQYLVEAARLVQKRKIEFLVAGSLGISDAAVASFPENVKMLGRVTRDQLRDVYQQAHVFVLPTLSDGFAITQLEAMAHALPVIATPNCGRVVTDGIDGFIIPARDGRALAEAFVRFDNDRAMLRAMSENALRTALRHDLPSNGVAIQKLVRVP